MVAVVCLSRPSTSKLLGGTNIRDCDAAVAGGCWSNYKTQGDGIRGASSDSASSVTTVMAAMDSGIPPNGMGGGSLVRWDNRGVTSSSRILLGKRRVPRHGLQMNCVYEVGLFRRFPKVVSFSRAEHPVKEALRRKRPSGVMEGLVKCRRWRARAAEDAEQDPLGAEGYWDGAEGKKQLNDIEDMKELIAEAENLRRAESSAERGPGELTSEEIEKQRAEKLREELARRAKEQAEQRKQAEIMFGMGQRAYGRGVYDKSVELLEAALSNVPGSSNLGGEIQIWLAMAYEAHNRHGDCIGLYRRLEATHPNKQIRRQAADLRYILEAPKLKISKEEMVSIPIIERDYDRGSKTWSQKIRDRRRKPMPVSKTKDYLEDWLVWDPPRWERSPYFWVALTVWLTLVGISLMFQD